MACIPADRPLKRGAGRGPGKGRSEMVRNSSIGPRDEVMEYPVKKDPHPRPRSDYGATSSDAIALPLSL